MSVGEPGPPHPPTTTGPDATSSPQAARDAPSAPRGARDPQPRPDTHPKREAPDAPHGVHVHDLLRHGRDQFLGAGELERWLIRSGFARRDGGPGLLVPTELGVEAADALAAMLT